MAVITAWKLNRLRFPGACSTAWTLARVEAQLPSSNCILRESSPSEVTGGVAVAGPQLGENDLRVYNILGPHFVT